MTFFGTTDLVSAEIDGWTEDIAVTPESHVLQQGRRSQLLYCVERGRVEIYRRRQGHQELGVVEAGSFFGELGALSGLPSTISAIAAGDCALRVVTRAQVRQRASRAQAPGILALLRSFYLETAIQLSGLFTGDEGSQIDYEWVRFETGDRLAQQGVSGPILVLMTGVARVELPGEERDQHLGFAYPGDLCGEIDPCPTTVTAESTVTAIRVPRNLIPQLSPTSQREIDQRTEACQQALSKLSETA